MEDSSRSISVEFGNHVSFNPERSTLPIDLVGDRIIIDPIEPDKYLPGSGDTRMIKPIDYKEPFMQGIIMNIGTDDYGQTIPRSFKPGKQVAYYHQSAIDYVINKKVYHLVRASDIFGEL